MGALYKGMAVSGILAAIAFYFVAQNTSPGYLRKGGGL